MNKIKTLKKYLGRIKIWREKLSIIHVKKREEIVSNQAQYISNMYRSLYESQKS